MNNNYIFDDAFYNILNIFPNYAQFSDVNDNQNSLKGIINGKNELHNYNDNQSNKIYQLFESNQSPLEQEIDIRQTQSTTNKKNTNSNGNNNRLNHTPFILLKLRGKKRKDPLNKRPIHDAKSTDNIISNIFHRLYNNSLNYINMLLTKEKKENLKK